jgi:hypothetical protein
MEDPGHYQLPFHRGGASSLVRGELIRHRCLIRRVICPHVPRCGNYRGGSVLGGGSGGLQYRQTTTKHRSTTQM